MCSVADGMVPCWLQVVDGDAKAKVLRSVDRYVGVLNGTIPLKYT